MTHERLDLRLAPAALGAWAAAALGLGWAPARAVLGAGLLLVAAAWLAWRDRRRPHRQADHDRTGPRGGRPALVPSLVAGLIATAAAFGVAGLRTSAVQAGPIDELARAKAY